MVKTRRSGAAAPRAASSGESGQAAALQALRTGEARDLEAAADRLRAGVEADPSDARLARLLGEVLEAAGKPEQALAVLESAAKHSRGDADLLMVLGYARLAAGRTNEARRAFERALALRPADSVIRRPLAQVYESLGEAALAAETLAAIPRETASPRVLGDLTRLYLGSKRYREAEEACGALLATDPEHALLAQHGLTLCRIKRGDWRGALEMALTATRLDRFDLTTAFLAYARDRLFARVPDAAQREAELSERFLAELKEHQDQHGEDDASPESNAEGEVAGG
jgi:tetratricopeptide (TPR) repeat protein